MNFLASWCLIFISVCAGYFMEKWFLHVRNWLSSWRRLIAFVVLFYVINVNVLIWLQERDMPIDNVSVETYKSSQESQAYSFLKTSYKFKGNWTF